MNFENTWYIIDHNKQTTVIAHKDLVALDSSTYQMIENFGSHQEALAAMTKIALSDLAKANQRLDEI
jgi:hypothetical protein